LIKTGTTRPCLTLPPYQGNGLNKTRTTRPCLTLPPYQGNGLIKTRTTRPCLGHFFISDRNVNLNLFLLSKSLDI
jgi:hypothetical protein